MLLEDNPLFNAGRGSVFTLDGRNELDASIMDGRNLQAGAVCGLTRIRNPVKLARAVMERSEHVMLAGAGAEEFASSQGFSFVPQSYFSHRRALAAIGAHSQRGNRTLRRYTISHVGTVGAVALDSFGHLAAATSTGGMTGKRFQRIGDSPIIGAGTYADDRSCAVSATGHGEIFIRAAVAHDICARMRFGGRSCGRSGAGSDFRGTPRPRRRRRRDRDRCAGRNRHGIQFRGDVSRQQKSGRRHSDRHLSVRPSVGCIELLGVDVMTALFEAPGPSWWRIRLPSRSRDFCPLPWRSTTPHRQVGSTLPGCGLRQAI